MTQNQGLVQRPYVVLNADNEVVNTIMWDGAPDWVPPPGHTAVPEDQYLSAPSIPVMPDGKG